MALPLLAAAGIAAAGGIGSSYLTSRSNKKIAQKNRKAQIEALRHPEKIKETKLQKTQRRLIDDLLLAAKGKGHGKYYDLFRADKKSLMFDPSSEAFQKSYVEPAKNLFRNQIAPQIQQSYIAGGQQRGTGLEDQLLRAGVSLDDILNKQMYDFQQKAFERQENLNMRKQDLFRTLLGQSGGQQYMPVPKEYSASPLSQATTGFISSPGFRDILTDITKEYMKPSGQTTFKQTWSEGTLPYDRRAGFWSSNEL